MAILNYILELFGTACSTSTGVVFHQSKRLRLTKQDSEIDGRDSCGIWKQAVKSYNVNNDEIRPSLWPYEMLSFRE
jgi:predicted secreted protein